MWFYTWRVGPQQNKETFVMRVRTSAARWISILAGLAVVVGGGVQIASASPNIGVITIVNADRPRSTAASCAGDVNDPNIVKVGFGMNRGRQQVAVAAARRGQRERRLGSPVRHVARRQREYDITAFGQRADKTIVRATRSR